MCRPWRDSELGEKRDPALKRWATLCRPASRDWLAAASMAEPSDPPVAQPKVGTPSEAGGLAYNAGGWPRLQCGCPIRASFARVGLFVSWPQMR